MDLVLSSGYLAFARHIGVLRAVEELGLDVQGVCGTSSGALIGALWAAGLSSDALLDEIARRRPLQWTRPHWPPWRGLLSLAPLLERLREQLPPSFENLRRPLAVGVVDDRGQHALLHSGPLPEAVAASCAIPHLFAPIEIAGQTYSDGGARDRIGLDAWRAWRGEHLVLLHLVERSHGPSHGPLPENVTVLPSARSGAGLWSLGDIPRQVEETRCSARRLLEKAALA
ncbi:MAG: patatin-like phospholipase family protein [Pseudomonadota bacterium]